MDAYLIFIVIFIIIISYCGNLFGGENKVESVGKAKVKKNISVKTDKITEKNRDKTGNTDIKHRCPDGISIKRPPTKLLTYNPKKRSPSTSSSHSFIKWRPRKTSFHAINFKPKKNLINSKKSNEAKRSIKFPREVIISEKRNPGNVYSDVSCKSSSNSNHSSFQQVCNCRHFCQKKNPQRPYNSPSSKFNFRFATKVSKEEFKLKKHESTNTNYLYFYSSMETVFPKRNDFKKFDSRYHIDEIAKQFHLPRNDHDQRMPDDYSSIEYDRGDNIPTSNYNNNNCSTTSGDDVDGKSSFEGSEDSMEVESMKSKSAKLTMSSDFCRKIIKSMRQKVLKIGKYRCFYEIGRGSFGKVLFALCKSSKSCHREYAIKLLHKRLGQCRIETMILKMVKNIPFFVQLLESFQTEQYLCFVMVHEPRGSLRDQIGLEDRRKYSRGEAAFYSGCIIMALNYLHSKDILHGDVKPDNILIDSDGYPKLTDFGMSVPFFGDDQEIQARTGTSYYMSPEMFYGEFITKATDFYSLAVMIYELMSGESPREFRFYQQDEKAETVAVNLGRVTNHFLSEMLGKNKKERLGYGSNGGYKILMHEFFEGFSNKLFNRNIKPPLALRQQDLIKSFPRQPIFLEHQDWTFDYKRDKNIFSDFKFVEITYAS